MKQLLAYTFLISTYFSSAQSNVSNFQIAPNPACNNLLVRFTLNQPDSISLIVLNMLGQTDLQLLKKNPLTAGSHNLNFPLDSLKDGMYILTLLSDTNKKSQQLLKVCTTNGIEQANNQTEPFKIYPNPTTKKLTILSNQITTATITNLLGQTLKAEQIVNNTIDVEDLPQATYCIQLYDKDKRLLVKSFFVKE